jgi:hypothetical protein
VKISKGNPANRAVCLKWHALCADGHITLFIYYKKNPATGSCPLKAISGTPLHDFPDLMRAGRSLCFDKVFGNFFPKKVT